MYCGLNAYMDMKDNQDIWEYKPSQEYFYRKENIYVLTTNGKYSTGDSYVVLIGMQRKMRIAELILNKISQPRHTFIVWLAVQDRLLTKIDYKV